MKPARKVIIDGLEYAVTDRLGYQHSRGVYAIEVERDGQTRICTSRSAAGPWEFNRPWVLIGGPITGQNTNQ